MLKLSKQNGKSEGRWVTYTEGVEIKVRPVTGSILRDLRRSATKQTLQPDPASRKMVTVDDLDEEAFERATADYIIEDFKGIGDADGTALDVSLDTKLLILDQIGIRDFIWAAAQALDVEAEQKKTL